MNEERLLAYYDQVTDEPDAIARLRRFILDLAVRGKLVRQDANDEPASELLKPQRARRSSLSIAPLRCAALSGTLRGAQCCRRRFLLRRGRCVTFEAQNRGCLSQ
jgi:hypothetical protein